jgi:hypothetical protein
MKPGLRRSHGVVYFVVTTGTLRWLTNMGLSSLAQKIPFAQKFGSLHKNSAQQNPGRTSPGPVRVANSVGLLLFGNEAELLHHAQIIVAVPVLDYLASFDAANSDVFDLYLPPGGRAKLLYLSLVSTA